MSNISTAHCRGGYLREFAHKTIPGVDIPNPDGNLPELRRLRFKPIKDDLQMDKVVKRYATRPGEYVTVYSFERLTEKGVIEYSTAKINRVYLDFDCDDNPQRAVGEAIMTVRVLIRHGIYCHCYYSGGRGIALYIEFKTVDIRPENKKVVLSLFCEKLRNIIAAEYENFFGLWIKPTQEGFGAVYETLDSGVIGDIARVSRIPNTRHKSGLYCIPLTFGDMYQGIEHIKEIAKSQREHDLEDVIITNMLRNEKMPTIITNLEKEVIANRAYELQLNRIKQIHNELIKARHPDRKGWLSDSDIQRAKDTPLSQVISSANRMKCPVHGGDNPTSFYIDHKKNYWYCYSCGKGGDAITFLMESQHLDFKTAVMTLAGKAKAGRVTA